MIACTRRATLRYVSCSSSPRGDFLFKLYYSKNVEYLKATLILLFKGFNVKRKSPQGDLNQETHRKHPVLYVVPCVAQRSAPWSFQRPGFQTRSLKPLSLCRSPSRFESRERQGLDLNVTPRDHCIWRRRRPVLNPVPNACRVPELAARRRLRRGGETLVGIPKVGRTALGLPRAACEELQTCLAHWPRLLGLPRSPSSGDYWELLI